MDGGSKTHALSPAMQRTFVNDPISVIVTTYNREDALDAALRALSRQTDRNFEIIVADDGSGPATSNVVERWAARRGPTIIHVWQEDRGFRLCEARNRGILASSGTYCIFLDGDCIAPPNYVASHRTLAEAKWFVAGNRVLLSSDLTGHALAEAAELEHWRFGAWMARRWHRDINRLGPLLALPLGPLRKLRAHAWRGARGGNLAVWRSDLDDVDGFDASYNGWGLEDSDLLIRLLRSGVRRKDGNFATGVLHLWHPENDRSSLSDNRRRLDEVARGDRRRATKGLSALKEAAVGG